ncbi:MAG: rhodanese-like domain-containing protein [Methanoregula sp.]|nr:rhodanese-like domain-containing protein [Methanoregula sp.]
MIFPPKIGSLILLIAIAMICAGCMQPAQSGSKTAAGYSDVTAQEARSLKHVSGGKLVIIDISAEYDEGHLPMAVSIPLDTLDIKLPTLDKSKPCLVYGHSDETSIAGATKLVGAGFSPVYRLKGNYASWVTAGYPAE